MKFKKCKFCGAVVPIDVKGCTSCGGSFKSSKISPSPRTRRLTQQRRTLLKVVVLLIAFLALVVIIGSALNSTTSSNVPASTGGNVTTSPVNASSSGAKYPPYPVNLYEFYRTDCPHCQALAPTIDALAAKYPTLHVYKIET